MFVSSYSVYVSCSIISYYWKTKSFLTLLIKIIGTTNWIDVCPTDANLLASGGTDKIVKVYDQRESKILEIYKGIELGKIDLNILSRFDINKSLVRNHQLRPMESK